MKSSSRSKLIRQAASFPKGSKERRAILTKVANSDWDDYMLVDGNHLVSLTQASPELIQTEIKKASAALQKVRKIARSILAIPPPKRSAVPMEYVVQLMDYLGGAEEHIFDLQFVIKDWRRGV